MRVPVAQSVMAVRALTSTSPSALNTTLQLPTHKPANAEHLSPQLAGFSIEMDRWPDWAGEAVGKPNEYTNQLLRNLGERTGVMPYLRVGANSEDRTTVDYSVDTIRSTFPDPTPDVPNPEADHNYIGKDYYALSGNFPAGTTFQWGLNLRDLNKTETVRQAELLGDTFQGSRADVVKHVHLANVEIGNEPDFYGDGYPGHPGPLKNWQPRNYSDSWRDIAKGVVEKINFDGDDKPKLSPGAITGFVMPTWSAAAFFQSGLLDDQDLKAKTDQFTEHKYSGVFSAGMNYPPGALMNKVTMRSNFSMLAVNINAARAEGLKYVLGETNSYANHGIPGLSNTLEGALWMIDMLLLSASNGVERCHFHHGRGFRYNTFQPISESDDGTNITHPHILPSYNSLLFVNEAIGKTGDAWVAEIPTLTTNVTSYGIYENKQLTRIVVLNEQVYKGEGERGAYNVKLDGWQDGWSGSVKRLLGPKTNTLTGVTWAGQTFETLSGVPEGEVETEELKDGHITLEASSAVLISLNK